MNEYDSNRIIDTVKKIGFQKLTIIKMQIVTYLIHVISEIRLKKKYIMI